MVAVATTTLPIGTIVLDAKAQNADTSERVRYYLIQAIQALDSDDNAEAIKQLQLATDQMSSPTGISVQSNAVGVSSDGASENGNDGESGESSNDGERDDEGEESEEGSGEDADEPGDTDENDEED